MQSRADRFVEAYVAMAKTAGYRPEAPSDGVGTILLTDEGLASPELLAEEAARYARKMLKQDDDAAFTLYGCTDFDHNKMFLYLFNAAGLCFSGGSVEPIIKRLLTMALEELD